MLTRSKMTSFIHIKLHFTLIYFSNFPPHKKRFNIKYLIVIFFHFLSNTCDHDFYFFFTALSFVFHFNTFQDFISLLLPLHFFFAYYPLLYFMIFLLALPFFAIIFQQVILVRAYQRKSHQIPFYAVYRTILQNRTTKSLISFALIQK